MLSAANAQIQGHAFFFLFILYIFVFLFSVFFELLFPIAVILLSSAIRILIVKDKIEAQASQEFSINPQRCQYQSQQITKLVFAPENDFNTNLMKDVVKNFDVDLIVFENGAGLNSWIKNQTEPIAAVLFDEVC